jgi:hypothetical protein
MMDLLQSLGASWLEDWRTLFGDERASYAEALERNYE